MSTVMALKRLYLLVPLLVVVALLVGALVLGLRTEDYARVTSPDQRFIAVATYRSYQACIPRMPGGGGDKPGFITVYRRDGTSCGRAPVAMVSELASLRWDDGSVSLPAEASWDLVGCTVEITNDH